MKNNSSNPFVSIIIPVFNSEKTLELSLKAIFESDYSNFEVIVVDDKSTDDSVRIARKFPCRVIQKNINTGAADSRNIGVESARYEILLFIDSDCIVKKDTITKIVESFKKGSDIVAGTYSNLPYNKNDLFSSYHSLFCYYNYMNSSAALFGTQCAAIKKKIFKKLGGFDNSIKGAGGEDLKLQYKIESIKPKLHVNMKAQVFHNSRHSLTTLLKNYYNRSIVNTKVLLEMKKFVPKKEEYIFNYTTLMSYLALFIAIFSLFLIYLDTFFILIFLLSSLAFLLFRKRFYSLIKNKRQLVNFIFLSFICDLVIMFGGFVGVLTYLRERLFKSNT